MSARAPLAALLSLAVVLSPTPAPAQKLQDIGVTSVGNPVLLEAGTVSRAGGIVTATVRVRFLKPIKAGAVEYKSSRTIAMFDCAKGTVAVKENWYFSDDKGKAIANHKVVGKPGFGSPIKGSLPDVAMAHLCKAS